MVSGGEGNQLQNLINFARGDGRPPPGSSGSVAGRAGSEAGRFGDALSLAAPASPLPPQQALIPPPIPFAGNEQLAGRI